MKCGFFSTNMQRCCFFVTFFYLIEGMEVVCFYGEVFKINAFASYLGYGGYGGIGLNKRSLIIILLFFVQKVISTVRRNTISVTCK